MPLSKSVSLKVNALFFKIIFTNRVFFTFIFDETFSSRSCFVSWLKTRRQSLSLRIGFFDPRKIVDLLFSPGTMTFNRDNLFNFLLIKKKPAHSLSQKSLCTPPNQKKLKLV